MPNLMKEHSLLYSCKKV